MAGKESVRPTRMEMLNTKSKLLLATKGHHILKQKRDALVPEFFKIVKKAKNLRGEVDAEMAAAFKALAIAKAFHGDLFVETAAIASKKVPEIEVHTRNIMGVKIAEIRGIDVRKDLEGRGYSIQGSSAKFDDAVEHFEKALDLIIKLAEFETALRRLLREIEKTNRKVNALEYNIQPDLKETIKEIAAHLNRLESEAFYALKVTKKKLSKAEEAAQAA
ncbi:MAG TPA: V-type ATP synthase subunit D [Candidatus Norongarragalinales archaeon]|nr:V-type ATP synthase subunit D [Candidatus Norongarragalinales archaeon]